ncbi:NAD(P)-binding protein [Panus rudis PR-1116 ss-1]|nr:NAD(P)-binding protein [Panus rudis PR-1116 ss-1]
MAPIRLGIIGLSTTGWAAEALVPPLFDPLLKDKYDLVALCTTNKESASAAGEKYKKLAGHEIKTYYGEEGYAKIANNPDVDLIAVSVKIPDHLKTIAPAIEAGKDIFVEWTPGANLQQTEQIAEFIKKKNLRCLVGAQVKPSATIRKLKELVHSGAIGRVLSTSIIMGVGVGAKLWGPRIWKSVQYAADINNGATALTIPIGHLLVGLTDVLGDFKEVTTTTAIQYPEAEVVDWSNQPTGEKIHNTSPEQTALTGIVSGRPYSSDVFLNLHCRGGLSDVKGRTIFRWIIDGEEGTIELTEHEGDTRGSLIMQRDLKIRLNGEEVPLDKVEVDKLGNEGKQWLEFAKGDNGHYTTIDDAVRIHRVLDAALRSSQEGKKVVLV